MSRILNGLLNSSLQQRILIIQIKNMLRAFEYYVTLCNFIT